MTYHEVIYEPGPVARVTMNRPEYRNAQSRLLLEEIDAAFQEAVDDPAVLVIVLSGNGPDFSAGHDLGSPPELADREIRGWDEDFVGVYDRQRDTRITNTLRWRNIPKPTIAMVHGKCIFGGWMVAASMDLIFASDDALFLPSHTQYFSAPWDVGVRKAKEILFQNRFIPAREAMELGFVNQVFPPMCWNAKRSSTPTRSPSVRRWRCASSNIQSTTCRTARASRRISMPAS